MRQSFPTKASPLRSLLTAATFALLLSGSALAQLTEPVLEEQSTPVGACKANLVNSKLVLTMWFADHNAAYPASVAELVPDYFVKSVHCPTAETQDYGYVRTEDGKTFTLTCPGNHQAEGVTEPPSITSDVETEAYWTSVEPD